MKFSIVVPTRNRPETLEKALQSCLAVDFDDVEIVICDNSDPESRIQVHRVAFSTGDSRVRVIDNPNSPCSMSRNWSYAIGQARGEFVTVVGDDDGFLDFGLSTAAKILNETEADILSWPGSCYRWPGCAETSRRNSLTISHGKEIGICEYSHIDAKALLQHCLCHPFAYYGLPMLYNAFIAKSLIEKLKSQSEDFFPSQSPDIYSGIAACVLAESVVRCDTSLALQGLSGRSNGLASMVSDGDAAIQSDFKALNALDGRGETKDVINIGVLTSQVADSFFRLTDIFPEECSHFNMTSSMVAGNQAMEVIERSHSDAACQDSLHKLRCHYQDDPRAMVAIENAIANRKRIQTATCDAGTLVFGLGACQATISGDLVGLTDIADASRFLSQLLRIREVRKVQETPYVKQLLRGVIPPLLLDGIRYFRRKLSAV